MHPGTKGSNSDAGRAVILFDGECGLCNSAVRFVISQDPMRYFAFAPLQSPRARELLAGFGGTAAFPGTMILIERGTVSTESTAALRVARRLGMPWRLAFPFIVLPRWLRDRVYRFVARNRRRWFPDVRCDIQAQDSISRFLS